MKLFKKFIIFLLLACINLLLTGCWNYREIDELAVVAGVAVDKGETHKYKLTAEIMHIEGGKDSKTTSRILTMEGNSMFDAVRNMISESGERLYWSHAKAIIVSRELAREGIIKIIDWYSRDAETRSDVNIMISGEKTAADIFNGREVSETIKSIDIQKIIENQKSISKAPTTQISEFINKISGDGIEPIAPIVFLEKKNGKKSSKTEGTALFQKDRLIGTISGEESKDFLFIINKLNGGILTQAEPINGGECTVSLEIFKNITKVNPDIVNGKLEMNIKTETEVAIDEIEGSADFIDDKGRKKLISDVERTLKSRLLGVIKKVQSEYGVDIFGFGSKIKQEKPDLWDSRAKDWNKIFKDLKVNVEVKIKIRNSAMTSKIIEEGD